MIKAVLCDLDGTMLDRDSSLKRFVTAQYDRLTEQLSHVPKQDYVDRFIELDNHGYVWKDIVYQQLIEEFSISSLTWEWLLADYINHFPCYCIPFPGMMETVRKWKAEKLLIGIITNGKSGFQRANITALGLDPYMDVILVSEAEGMKKPEPGIFQRAVDALCVSPETCVFLGDHPVNDIEGARNAGMQTAWKDDGRSKGVPADYIWKDWKELRPIFHR
ncbi:HAD family hydrolase [Halobacillus sp. ACCC02827]|uniref:HAD family hydrolase n=1 Tax=Halobacillus sp. ACCC02827 TaxID=3052090 RepID=UPI0025710202|nr:HAD family hydrolase [Halobacillus sp. ACCC02827]WJE14898.1 HAD family hydrolase [Halobacillus sp. ACCC02827]